MATPYVISGEILHVTAGEAIGEFIRVKYNSSNAVVICAAGEAHDGITVNAVASGGSVGIIPAGAPGIHKVSFTGTGSAGALIYPAASGKASTTANGLPIGQLAEAAVDGATVAFRTRPPDRAAGPAATGTKTSVYTAAFGECVVCDPSGAGFVVNLPAAVAGEKPIIVKNNTTSVNAITITRAGSDTIDGATTLAITSSRGVARLVPITGGWLAC